MFYKDQTFNLGETTNIRHVKKVCTKYASLIQFFNELFSVLKTFRNQRNHSNLMALHRKLTKLEHLASRALGNVTSEHSTTIYGCECTLMKSMGLPCKHLFKKHLQEGEKIFGKQFVKDRWTLSYYRTFSSTKFCQVPAPAEDDLESRLANVIEKENSKSILSQAQNFKRVVYLSQEIAAIASE